MGRTRKPLLVVIAIVVVLALVGAIAWAVMACLKKSN